MRLPWRKKEPPVGEPMTHIDYLRLRAAEALRRSVVAAEAADAALAKGKPTDCDEVRAAQCAIREANEAVAEWQDAGGVEALYPTA